MTTETRPITTDRAEKREVAELRAMLDADPNVGPPVTDEEEDEDTVAIGDALTDRLAALVESWREAETGR